MACYLQCYSQNRFFHIVTENMLRIITRALFYTAVFNAGIIIGGIYTPDVMEFTRSLGEDTTVDDSQPVKNNKPTTKQKLLVRTTV